MVQDISLGNLDLERLVRTEIGKPVGDLTAGDIRCLTTLTLQVPLSLQGIENLWNLQCVRIEASPGSETKIDLGQLLPLNKLHELHEVVIDAACIDWNSLAKGIFLRDKISVQVEVRYSETEEGETYDLKKYKEICDAINPICEGILPGWSNAAIVGSVYKRLEALIEYNSEGDREKFENSAAEARAQSARSLYSALVNRSASSLGYCRALAAVLDRYGIRCSIVEASKGKPYKWQNIVWIDGTRNVLWPPHSRTRGDSEGRTPGD